MSKLVAVLIAFILTTSTGSAQNAAGYIGVRSTGPTNTLDTPGDLTLLARVNQAGLEVLPPNGVVVDPAPGSVACYINRSSNTVDGGYYTACVVKGIKSGVDVNVELLAGSFSLGSSLYYGWGFRFPNRAPGDAYIVWRSTGVHAVSSSDSWKEAAGTTTPACYIIGLYRQGQVVGTSDGFCIVR
jgi:hypothetical protein